MLARRIGLALLGVLTCAVLLAGVPTSALAARGHLYETSFGSPGDGNGQLTEPEGVAVNEASGDVYVVDRGNDRVEWFSSTGAYEGKFDGSGSYEVKGKVETGTAAPSGAFSAPEAIAVDNACVQHRPQLTEATTPTCAEYDPSAGDVYVADVGHEAIDKFSASGEYLGQITEAEGVTLNEIKGVAVDAKGELWVAYKGGEYFDSTVASFSDAEVNALIAVREDRDPQGPILEPGLGVDAQDDVFLRFSGYGETGYVAEFDASGGIVNETVTEKPGRYLLAGITAELASGDVYVSYLTTIARFDPEGRKDEEFGAGHLGNATAIGVDGLSEDVYVADASANAIDVFGPEPPAAPRIEAESVSDVTATSATLNGEVNPRGPSSEYHFEYGPCATLAVSSCASSTYSESVPSPDESVGGGFPIVAVSRHVQDLVAHTTYHLRVVATNELGVTDGEEVIFTTQAVGSELLLPDGRQWELVSPPNTHGASMEQIAEGIVEASANGNAFADFAFVPTESQPLGNANATYVISGRGPSGWSSEDVATPHNESPGVPVGNGNEYRFFSEDLSRAFVQPFGSFTPFSPEASEQTAYLHTDFLDGEPSHLCSESCYTPLVNAANVPAGTEFGESEEGECKKATCGPAVRGVTPDADHAVLESPAQLTPTATEGHVELYEWNKGSLQLVSILPPGESNFSGGSAAEYPILGNSYTPRGAISDDGSLIVFEAYGESGTHLYLRDTVTQTTVRLDLPQGGSASGSHQPQYMTASADGSRVFFLDEAGLTSEGSETGIDLYEYDLEAPLGSRLKDLTPDGNSGQAAGVVNVLGASEDGSYVYFAATGALAPGATPGECGINLPAPSATLRCNLYVEHGGALELVAALSQEDFPDWAADSSDLSDMTGRVSPNGHFLAFMSQLPLVGYDNDDAISGKPDEEVYLYSVAASAEARPALVCASCDPTGARPIGQEYGADAVPRVGADRVWNDSEWIAALVPPWTRYRLTSVAYQSRYLSNSGRLFFDSHDPLLPEDVGGSWSVYEYEPPGVGSCTSAYATYSERVAGCQSLISSGTSSEESAFLDASESGDDVFFLTSQKLVSGDENGTPRVYDAHECTQSEPCYPTPVASPPPCETGDSCKAAPNPQPAVFGAPPSATFSGTGNLVPQTPARKKAKPQPTRKQKLKRALKSCKQHRQKRARQRCQRNARRLYAGSRTAKSKAVRTQARSGVNAQGKSNRSGR
ncbi:MAG TPA: hypothetical protein VGF95_07695 [Solirubrobacteraceae bacterium]|jgi:hypothetical protein